MYVECYTAYKKSKNVCSVTQAREALAGAATQWHFSASKRKFAATRLCFIATNVPILHEFV